MRLNQPQDRRPPLRAPILTKMVVSASATSVRMRRCSRWHRSTSGLLREWAADCRTHDLVARQSARIHHIQGGADDVSGVLIAALTASSHANRQWQRSPAVLAMRCSARSYWSKWPQPDAAPAALVSTQAARLSPGRTRHAAEPTAGPNAAATSADTDENGRVCVDGLGPYALLLKPQPEQRRPADTHHSHAPHAPHAGRS